MTLCVIHIIHFIDRKLLFEINRSVSLISELWSTPPPPLYPSLPPHMKSVRSRPVLTEMTDHMIVPLDITREGILCNSDKQGWSFQDDIVDTWLGWLFIVRNSHWITNLHHYEQSISNIFE